MIVDDQSLSFLTEVKAVDIEAVIAALGTGGLDSASKEADLQSR